MKKNVKKITVGGLLIALALVLPMAFHLTGVPQPDGYAGSRQIAVYDD